MHKPIQNERPRTNAVALLATLSLIGLLCLYHVAFLPLR